MCGYIDRENLSLIYWLVPSSRRRGKGVDKDIVNLASCGYYFIRVHENLVQHPNNNKSICKYKLGVHSLPQILY